MAFRMQAAAAGLPVETSGTTATSPIIPIITGGSAGALALAAALEREGVLAAPMLPPSVPAGASRVRFFVSAAHAEFQVSAAVAALVRAYPAVIL
jgi:8-amino-7-oxononanoate synthase